MIIAIASEGNQVAGHFGHCEGFNIFKAENNEIASSEFITNPGHRPGFLPVFLHEKGVNVIISGTQGNVTEIAQAYLQGNLQSSGSVCQEHMHHGDCGH